MLTRWNDIDRMFRTINLLRHSLDGFTSDFDRQFGWNLGWGDDSHVPRTNFYDLGDRFEVQAEVPGIGKEDLALKIQGNYLEITGSRKTEVPEGYTAHRLERKKLSFTRSFTLPADVDAEKAEARLQDGILYLLLPKAAAAKPRKITIG